jgi:MFS family permease
MHELTDKAVFSPKKKASSQTYQAWMICLSAGLFFFYEFFQLNLFDVINSSLREDFNLNASSLSWMSSYYLWANVLFLLPAGILLDKYSVRRIILIDMVCCISATVGFALTHDFFWATLFHAMTGMGNSFCFLACVILVSRWFPSDRQAFVMGVIVTIAFLGGVMAHTPLAHLNQMLGWRSALLWDAGLGVVILMVLLGALKDGTVALKAETQQKNTLRAVLRNPQNILAGLFTSCLNLPIMVLSALWGATALQALYNLPAIDASNVVSMIYLGSIVGCPLVGWWSDRIGRRKPLMVSGACLTLITLMPLVLGWTLSLGTLEVLFFFIGFITSTQVISYPMIAESNHASHVGFATGIASLIIMAGGAVGQVLFGWLMQQHMQQGAGSYRSADFHFALWIFPIAAVIALLSVLLTRETFCGHAQKGDPLNAKNS